MKVQIKSLAIFITFLSIFSSCVKDCDQNKIAATHDLNFYNQIMVYKDFDTIRFLKNGMDKVLFYAGKIDNSYDVIPAQDCGKEQFQHVNQKFKSNEKDSIQIQYGKMLMYENPLESFFVIFNKIYFQGQPKDIVNCTENIDVLGKSYCVEKCMPAASLGGEPKGDEYIYYTKGLGIVKAFVNNNTYERLP